jgi:hypothetical protein
MAEARGNGGQGHAAREEIRRVGVAQRVKAPLTRQFNPSTGGAKSLGQWLTAVASMKGESTAMPVRDAVAMIRATPPDKRSEFAREIWDRRRAQYGPSGRSDAGPF